MKFKKRLEEIKKEYEKLNAQKEQIVSNINKQQEVLQQTITAMNRLDGAYNELSKLEDKK